MGMATEVTSLLRPTKGVDTNTNDSSVEKPTLTMDLLALDSKELDLDLHVPCGWEKRLDLKSGKIYLRRCNSSAHSKPDSKPLNLFDDDNLDLNLRVSLSPSGFQSACTLDKVKSALERAEREGGTRKRSVSSSTSLCSNSSSSVKGGQLEQEERSSGSFAASCPSCLTYVIITRGYPKCPRCYCDVPVPAAAKRARIDLNLSI